MEIHLNINRLLDNLAETGKPYDLDKIKSAYDYAEKMHEGQFRASGEAYISHPIAVAEIVASLELDTDSICAALLHDTVEDCSDKTNLNEIKKLFGDDVAMLVDGLTKLVDLKIEDKEEAHMESLRKMLLAMSKDVRVIFIKLCDRLHNMRTLDAKPEEKRRLTALETMHVYAPLAHRLGMQKIKSELENLSLGYLDPIGYEEIKKHIESKYGQSAQFIEKIRRTVEEKLKENNVKFSLEGRIKSVYSIYKKMYNQNKSFDEIYDFYALRIIVDTEIECYTVLGLIHEMFNSMPGRFKDYISTPKANMYRSLHTTVIGRDGIPFEVQIRTWDMHHIAEYGICAHWKYKTGSNSKDDIDKKLEWIARLVETEDGTRDPEEFMHALKTDIFHDEVFVFTPNGDVISLAYGSTPIDFAYAIHSAVGNKMIGAKINGMIVPIDRVLQSGEIVEVMTSSASKGPSRDWLNIVKTSEARTKIRAWFKKEKRSENIVVGRSMVESELRKRFARATESQKNDIYTAVATKSGFSSAEDMFNTLGYGGLTLGKIIIKLNDEIDRVISQSKPIEPVEEENIIKATAHPKKVRSNGGIVIDGEYGCAVKFSKCCNPLPGDDVVGFITKGFGISIHKKDCPNVISGKQNPENAERWVSAWWESDVEGVSDNSVYEAMFQIYAVDKIGIMADIATMLAELKVSIHSINTKRRNNGDTIINLKIACKNIQAYNYIVERLKTIDGVTDIVRGFS